MEYGIGRAQKLGKINRKWLGNTIDTYSSTTTPLYGYDKLNENTDITSKTSLTADTHSISIFYIEDKPSDINQNKSESNP